MNGTLVLESDQGDIVVNRQGSVFVFRASSISREWKLRKRALQRIFNKEKIHGEVVYRGNGKVAFHYGKATVNIPIGEFEKIKPMVKNLKLNTQRHNGHVRLGV